MTKTAHRIGQILIRQNAMSRQSLSLKKMTTPDLTKMFRETTRLIKNAIASGTTNHTAAVATKVSVTIHLPMTSPEPILAHNLYQ